MCQQHSVLVHGFKSMVKRTSHRGGTVLCQLLRAVEKPTRRRRLLNQLTSFTTFTSTCARVHARDLALELFASFWKIAEHCQITLFTTFDKYMHRVRCDTVRYHDTVRVRYGTVVCIVRYGTIRYCTSVPHLYRTVPYRTVPIPCRNTRRYHCGTVQYTRIGERVELHCIRHGTTVQYTYRYGTVRFKYRTI